MTVYADGRVTVLHGDSIDLLPTLADDSIDAVTTDPPYGIIFMGKHWDDHHTPEQFQAWCEQWAAESLRVLKPRGHLLAFGGTRTYHRLAVAIEDAGFEIRDSIHWIYGSGFPKSLDVSKAIDKQRDDRADVLRVTAWLGQQMKAIGVRYADVLAHFGFNAGSGQVGHWTASSLGAQPAVPTWDQWVELSRWLNLVPEMDAEVWRLNGRKGTPGNEREDRLVGEPAGNSVFQPTQQVIHPGPVLDDAEKWQGWGTALKPAHEPILVARKPLAGTVAANVLEHGTGAINVDGCRIGTQEDLRRPFGTPSDHVGQLRNLPHGELNPASPLGRWPSNVVFTHDASCNGECATGCPVAELDAQSGEGTSAQRVGHRTGKEVGVLGAFAGQTDVVMGHADTGGASRFFPVFRYEPKADSAERPRDEASHPTVKPLDLMRWLVRLVTPPGGTVLDPFAGTGTTGEAALLEGMRATLIEREAAYLPLIRNRLTRRHDPAEFLRVTGAADDTLFADLEGGAA